jgi:hypothetical protein
LYLLEAGDSEGVCGDSVQGWEYLEGRMGRNDTGIQWDPVDDRRELHGPHGLEVRFFRLLNLIKNKKEGMMAILERSIRGKRVSSQESELRKAGLSTREIQKVVDYPTSCDVWKTESGYLVIRPTKEE